MTKNAKVISAAQATSATQTTSWEWSAPYFVKRAQEVQARLDLHRQTMNNLQDKYKNLQDQNKSLQDQNENQKKDYEREMNGCYGSFVVVVLLFAAVIICGYQRSSSPERCSYALEAKAVQMTATPTTVTVTLPVATPTTVTVTLPVATNAMPTIEAASAIKAASSTDAASSTEPFWSTLTREQIRFVVHDYRKIQDRYLHNNKVEQQEVDAKQKERDAEWAADMKQKVAQWDESLKKKIRQRIGEAQEEAQKQVQKQAEEQARRQRWLSGFRG